MDEDCDIYADLDLLPVHDFGSSFGVEANLKRKCSPNESAKSKSRRVEDERVQLNDSNNQNNNRELNCPRDCERGGSSRSSRGDCSRDRKRESKERDRKRESKERDRKKEGKERAHEFSRSGNFKGDRSNDRPSRKGSNPGDHHRSSKGVKPSESSSQNNVHAPNTRSSNVLASKAKPTDRILNQNKAPRQSPRKSPCKSPRKSPYSRASPKNLSKSPKKPNTKPNDPSGDHHLAELVVLEEKLLRLEEKCTTLESEKEQKAKDNLELNRMLTVLKTNISSLYRTAKTEIDRKSFQIKELQSEIDSLKFRKFKRADERANWGPQTPGNELNQFYW